MAINATRRRLVITLTAEVVAARASLQLMSGAGALLSLASCGGGEPNPAVAPTLAIQSLSPPLPVAMRSLTIGTTGLDTTQPFTVILQAKGKSGALTLKPIRVRSDGTVVVAMPLFIDGDTGTTSDLAASLTITQVGVTTAPADLTIAELPQLSSYGVNLGETSHAFLNYLQIGLATSYNAQQCIARFPNHNADSVALRQRLATLWVGSITARGDVDRIMADNSAAIPIGTVPDGTAVSYNKVSVDMQDRIIANYLAVLLSQTSSPQQSSMLTPKATTMALSGTLQAINTVSGAANVASTSQEFSSSSEITFDDLMSAISIANTIISVGASVVAVGAAVAGAPVVAAGAAAFASYAAMTGLLVAGATLTADAYNLGTSIAAAAMASGNDQQANEAALQAAVAFGISAVDVILQGSGIGATKGVAGDIAQSTLQQLFTTTGKDVGVGALALLQAATQIAADSAFGQDSETASQTLGELTSLESGGIGIANVKGTANITNQQDLSISGLTGIAVSGSAVDAFISTADSQGNYDLLVPVGIPGIDYSSLTLTAFDPLTDTLLTSTNINLTGVPPGGSTTAPTVNGSCSANAGGGAPGCGYPKTQPPAGSIPYRAVVYVDDGRCPAGQITQVTGGNNALGIPRGLACVARPALLH